MKVERVLLVGKLPPAMEPAIQALGLATAKAADMAEAVRVGPAVGVITSSEVAITAEHIEAVRGLEFIGRAAAGTENIDHAAARRLSIPVLSTPQATAPCAAELTMGHIVALLRRVPTVARKLQQGVWAKEMLGEEVAGKVLGIVGLGRVGGRVARLARAFGMRVIACDPYIPRARFRARGARPRTLRQLLTECDVLTLHTPLTDETRGMIGAAEIAMLRPGAWIVNCARGGIVQEDALLAALELGQIAGAAIDVWMGEPDVNRELLEHPAVLGTPHVGAATRQAKARLVTMMVEAVGAWLEKRKRA